MIQKNQKSNHKKTAIEGSGLLSEGNAFEIEIEIETEIDTSASLSNQKIEDGDEPQIHEYPASF